MVSIGGNLYSVPDTTRRRVFDAHVLADEIGIFESGVLVAIRHKPQATANPIPPTLKRRGRPPKNGGADHVDG